MTYNQMPSLTNTSDSVFRVVLLFLDQEKPKSGRCDDKAALIKKTGSHMFITL